MWTKPARSKFKCSLKPYTVCIGWIFTSDRQTDRQKGLLNSALRMLSRGVINETALRLWRGPGNRVRSLYAGDGYPRPSKRLGRLASLAQ